MSKNHKNQCNCDTCNAERESIMKKSGKISCWLTGLLGMVLTATLIAYLAVEKNDHPNTFWLVIILGIIGITLAGIIYSLQRKRNSLINLLEEANRPVNTARNYAKHVKAAANQTIESFEPLLPSKVLSWLPSNIIKNDESIGNFRLLLQTVRFEKTVLIGAMSTAITHLYSGYFSVLLGEFVGANDDKFLHELVYKAPEVSSNSLERYTLMLTSLISAGANLSETYKDRTPLELLDEQSYPLMTASEVAKLARLLIPPTK